MRNVFVLLFCLLSLSSLWSAETLVKIPFKQDPPIIVDGNLDDWDDVPVRIALNGKEHLLTPKKSEIVTEKDISGELAFCWKPIGLYMAAKVKDDKLVQKGGGMDVFNGDHIELYIDMIPNEKGDGPKFGKKQFQIGISPGDFGVHKAEIAVAHPNGLSLSPKAVCASEKTEDGWNLEAFIPWSDLEAGQLKGNEVIGFTAWIGDTDTDTGSSTAPGHILTTSKPDAAFRMRSDLGLAVFTDSNGRYTATISRAEGVLIAEKISVEPGKSQQLSFKMTAMPEYLTPVLRFNANIKTNHVFSGYARAMRILVNGKELDNYNLLVPENEFRTKNGEKGTIYQSGHGFLLPYTNDGKAGSLSANTLRFFANHYNMHDFALDLSGLLKPGENTVEFRNSLEPKNAKQLEALNIKVAFEAVEKKPARKGAPTGKLPFIALKPTIPISGEIAVNGAKIDIRQKNKAYTVSSRFSTPDGKWATGSNKYFRHERKVERTDEACEITDMFTNLTQENLPLIQEHHISVPGKKSVMYLCGIETASGRNIRRSLGNHSIFAGSEIGGGVGLYALNPEFQIHFGAFVSAPQTAAMCDDQTVIPPGRTAVRKFVLVSLEQGGYYDFVNVTRRHIGANTTLRGPGGSWAAYKWMEAYYERLNIYNINHLD
ncbi:MAG: hypothetical protein IKS20_05310, partial [Victivallales bacterium]|nr:hypothetical protein [Victivallales bacterium]